MNLTKAKLKDKLNIHFLEICAQLAFITIWFFLFNSFLLKTKI